MYLEKIPFDEEIIDEKINYDKVIISIFLLKRSINSNFLFKNKGNL